VSIVKYNRSKIICTIGPASESEEVLTQLMKEGMDVARLNFSHGTHAQHQAVVDRIRKINAKLGTHTSLLVDLQGPKIRIAALDKPHPIKQGDEIILSTAVTKQDGNILPIQYETFARDVNPGDLVLVDDGKVELVVLETDKKTTAKLRVNFGDEIGSKKGVNLPFTNISIPSITEKDLRDVEFGIANRVDWIALSFVRTASEVRELKEMLRARGAHARLMAKIEKPEALRNIDDIIEASDGIMVARGDLGVEIYMEDVPRWQKVIVQKSNRAGKPVVVATQMMESMITNRRPTRAETNDVANAVSDGADALMLSGETSTGRFPVEVVQSMQKIIASMESQEGIYYKNLTADNTSATYLNDAIIVNACDLAQKTNAQAIVGMTVSGYTAYQLSRCRPKAHIFIFTHDPDMLTVLNLVWGVRTFLYDEYKSTDQTFHDIKELLKAKNLVRPGDVIINTASMPIDERQRTNAVKIGVVD
jgi:pyruvate kinase